MEGTDSPSQGFEMTFREKSAWILGLIPSPRPSKELCDSGGMLVSAWESKLVFTRNNGAYFVATVSDNTCAESVTIFHANS